jgi:hypothetical protein
MKGCGSSGSAIRLPLSPFLRLSADPAVAAGRGWHVLAAALTVMFISAPLAVAAEGSLDSRVAPHAKPLCTKAQAAHPVANNCRPRMTAKRRAEIMARLCTQMAENGQTPPRCRPVVKGGPEPLADPTPQ